jgi:Patatin-like phospholipase
VERETPYSPRQRTALVLSGTGTAGAYHAGVLRALHEAGVKIDIVAGRGMGAVGALFSAVDAASRLWEQNGLWLGRPQVRGLYEWRGVWRAAGWSLAFAVAALCVPIVVLALGALAYPILLLVELITPATGATVTTRFTAMLSEWFSGGLVSALVSRLVTAGVLVLMGTFVAGWIRERTRRPRRRTRGAPWWQALGAPMSTGHAVQWATGGFWSFIHGATPLPQPARDELSRRYGELLAENLGQPGYRELILTAHDLETRRDLVFALIAADGRSRFFGPLSGKLDSGRRAELVDLAGTGRDHVMDAIAAALSVPILTEPHLVTFGTDTFWRGETHRACDRPAALVRLIEEVSAAGAEQVIIVSADAPLDRAHALSARQVDPRALLADYLAGAETAATRDGVTALFDRFSGVFQIMPTHNPIGPFAFAGAYDERSDRVQPLKELMDRGYEDAYRQFIEPVVGASGEALESPPPRPPADDDRSAPISAMLAGLD